MAAHPGHPQRRAPLLRQAIKIRRPRVRDLPQMTQEVGGTSVGRSTSPGQGGRVALWSRALEAPVSRPTSMPALLQVGPSGAAKRGDA